MFKVYFILLLINFNLIFYDSFPIENRSKKSLSAYVNDDTSHNGYYEGTFLELMRENYGNKFNKNFNKPLKSASLDSKGQLNMKDMLKDFKNGNKKGGYDSAIKYFAQIVKTSESDELKTESFRLLSTASFLRKTLEGKDKLNNAHENMQKAFSESAGEIFSTIGFGENEKGQREVQSSALNSLGDTLSGLTNDNIKTSILNSVDFKNQDDQAAFEQSVNRNNASLNKNGSVKTNKQQSKTKKSSKKPNVKPGNKNNNNKNTNKNNSNNKGSKNK